MPENFEKLKRLTFRELIFLALGLVGGVGAVTLTPLSDSLQKGRSGQDASASQFTDSASALRNGNWVGGDEFDKDPLSYVDPTQCRNLVLQWDGSVITEDEILDKAVEIQNLREQADFAEKARNIIKKYCVESLKDQAKIQEAISSGCGNLDPEQPIYFSARENKWSFESERGDCPSIELGERPHCLSEDEIRDAENTKANYKKEEAAKDEIIKLIGKSKIKEWFADEDILKMRRFVKENKLEALFDEKFFNTIDRLAEYGSLSDEGKEIYACDLMSAFASVAIRGDDPRFSISKADQEILANSPSYVENFMDKFEQLATLLGEMENLDDFERCALLVYKK